jgi:hypothetical protein
MLQVGLIGHGYIFLLVSKLFADEHDKDLFRGRSYLVQHI